MLVVPVRLTQKLACSASFFSRNSVFLSQQFSQNSVFQPVSAKIQLVVDILGKPLYLSILPDVCVLAQILNYRLFTIYLPPLASEDPFIVVSMGQLHRHATLICPVST